MVEELLYIKDLKNEELIDIISNVWGFEETAEALLQLKQRLPDKALELGIVLLEEDKGDDYLQASVWDMIFDINPLLTIEHVSRRTALMGKTLMHDILEELAMEYSFKDLTKLPSEFLEKINQSYQAMGSEIQTDLAELYYSVCEKVNRK